MPEPVLTVDEVIRRHVVAVLEANDWNKSRSARLLGIHTRTLYYWLDKWGVAPKAGPSLIGRLRDENARLRAELEAARREAAE